MARILRIFTSRWTEGATVILMLLTLYTQNRVLWIASCVIVAAIVSAILISSLSTFRNIRRAWQQYPDTSEYREFIENKKAKQAENNQNKIELK